MKPFLGYQIEQGKGMLMDISQFVNRQVEKQQIQCVENSAREYEEVKKNIPKILGVAVSISGLIVIIGLIAFEYLNISVSEAFIRYPVISSIVLASIIVFTAILIFIYINQKLLNKTDEYLKAKAEKERISQISYEMLEVPNTACDVDVFLVQYKVKNSGIKNVGISNILKYKAYIQNGKLNLANEVVVLGVPIESLKRIVTIKNKMSFYKWEKEEHYRKFGVKRRKYGYYVPKYYALCIDHGNEQYGLYFPPYELPLIEKLTGMKAE